MHALYSRLSDKRFVALAVLFGALLACFTGCEAPEPTALVLVPVDVSASMTEEERRAACGPLLLLADEFEGRVRLGLYAYSTKVEKSFMAAPYDADDVLPAVKQLVTAPPGREKGTYQSIALANCVREIEKQSLPAFVFLATDGEDMDVNATREAAQALAALPVEGVMVAPVLQQYRAPLEAALEPLGARAIVASGNDLKFAVQQFRKQILSVVNQGGRV